MIRSFKCKDTERIFNRQGTRKLSIEVQRQAQRKLIMIHSAIDLRGLSAPRGNRLEKLSGNREGQLSIRINDKWRICFEWQDGNAENVEITDYH